VTAPSGDQEGLPTVVVEALAAGKPVVATDHGGIPEAVTDGVIGFLVPERDVAGLTDRLLTLLQDPQLCDQVGKAGRATAVEHFSIARQTGKLESLYRTFI
jgi:colanic acid/amylovoran biosynthesis glycosyltransferase